MSGNWAQVTISDVAELVRGVTYAKQDSRDTPAEGFSPILRATNIQDSRLVLESDLVYVPAREVSPAQRLRAGDIVMATSSGSKHLVGKSALMRTDWVGSFGAFCATLRAKPAIDPRYLSSFLQSPAYWKQVTKKALGVNINNLRRGDIEALVLPLPTLNEQREIVAEIEKQFSRLDEAVTNLQRVKANLKRYKASVLKDAVEGHLVPTEAELARREGRSFEAGEQLLHRVLEAQRNQWQGKGKYKEPTVQVLPGDDLPVGWTRATMEQLGVVQLGRMLDKQKHTSGEPYRYLRNVNVRWGSFDLSDLFEMNFESIHLERFGVRDGDVLVCEGGEPARAAVWRMGVTDIKYQKALHRVRFDGAFLPELLVIALEHFAKSGALEKMFGGSTIKHFTREVFVTLCVAVPPILEQYRIVAEVDRRLSLVGSVEAEVNANLRRAQALRQSVLNKSFSE